MNDQRGRKVEGGDMPGVRDRRFDSFLTVDAWLAGDINEMRRLLGKAAVDDSSTALLEAAQVGRDALDALSTSDALRNVLGRHYNNSVRHEQGFGLRKRLRKDVELLLSFLEMERRLLIRTGLSVEACNAIIGDCRRVIEADFTPDNSNADTSNSADAYSATVMTALKAQRDEVDQILKEMREEVNQRDIVERGWFRRVRQVVKVHGGVLVLAVNYGADEVLRLNQAAMAVSGSTGLALWLGNVLRNDRPEPAPTRPEKHPR